MSLTKGYILDNKTTKTLSLIYYNIDTKTLINSKIFKGLDKVKNLNKT